MIISDSSSIKQNELLFHKLAPTVYKSQLSLNEKEKKVIILNKNIELMTGKLNILIDDIHLEKEYVQSLKLSIEKEMIIIEQYKTQMQNINYTEKVPIVNNNSSTTTCERDDTIDKPKIKMSPSNEIILKTLERVYTILSDK